MPGVTGRDRAGEDRVVLDEARPRVGVLLRQQFLRRYVLEGRVADPAPAVRERDAAGLQVVVQVLDLARLREVRPLQDVERLANGRATGGGGRDGVDAETAVRGPGGRLEPRAVGREILVGQLSRAGVPARTRVHGRLVHGVDDVLAQIPVVDRAYALLGQLLVGAGEIGVLEGGADRRQLPAGQEQLGRVGEVAEPGLVRGRLRAEGVVGGEAVAGDSLGGLEDRTETSAPPGVERGLPGGGRARRADAQTAADGVGEGERLAVLDEEVGVGAQGAVSRPSMVCTVRDLAS